MDREEFGLYKRRHPQFIVEQIDRDSELYAAAVARQSVAAPVSRHIIRAGGEFRNTAMPGTEN